MFVFQYIVTIPFTAEEATAKQLITAYPTSFVASEWDNAPAMMQRETTENSTLGDFNASNSGSPGSRAIEIILKQEITDVIDVGTSTPSPVPVTTTSSTPAVSSSTIPEPNTTIPATTTTSTQSAMKRFFSPLMQAVTGVVYAKPDTASSTEAEIIIPEEQPAVVKEEKNSKKPDEATTSTPPISQKPEKTDVATTSTTSTPLNPSLEPLLKSSPASTTTSTLFDLSDITTSSEENITPAPIQLGPVREQSYVILSQFVIDNTRGQFDEYADLKNPYLVLSVANEELHGHEILVSYYDEAIPQKIVSLKLDIARSTKENGGYFYFSLPHIENIRTLTGLQIRIADIGSSQLKKEDQVFIDAVWFEAQYNDGKAKKNLEDTPLALVSDKKDFKLGEDLAFDFVYKKNESPIQLIKNHLTDTINRLLGDTVSAESEPFDVQVAVLDNNNTEQSDIEPTVVFKGKNDFTVSIAKDQRKLKPGTYTLSMSLYTPSGVDIYEQTFTWGVLAINVNKSVYTPGETAHIQMAALREDGHTICDANLELTVTSPSNAATIVPITPSGKCGPNNVIDVPDYSAYYQISDIGTYTLTLINKDTNYKISDSFYVETYVPFSIERTGPTRIFPPADYVVSIIVTPNEQFTGTITDYAPDNFTISKVSVSESSTSTKKLKKQSGVPIHIENLGKETAISAEVSWKPGKTYVLTYTFNAPDISPYMFTLGPATLNAQPEKNIKPIVTQPASTTTSSAFIVEEQAETENAPVFMGTYAEKRQWQIASDAVGMVDPNADGTVGCTPTPSGNHYSTVDDGTRSPSTPDSSDYITCLENEADFFSMTSLTEVATVTQIDAYAYYINDNTVMQWEVELWNSAETTQYGTTQQLANRPAIGWNSVSFTGLSLTQSELDGLKIKYKNVRTAPGTGTTSRLYAQYASVTYTPSNSAPSISNVSINGGIDIVLSESTSTFMLVTSTISDADGYADMTSYTAKLYRSGVTSTNSCTADDNNCYNSNFCNTSNCSGNSCTLSCGFSIKFHAEPTDTGTPWASEYWRAWMQVTDSASHSASAFSAAGTPEMTSLLSLDISTSTNINYGTLVPVSSPDGAPINQKATIIATGNTSLDITIYGSPFTYQSSTIDTTYQRFSMTSGTTYQSGTSVTSSPGVEIELDIKKPTSTAVISEGYIWLGARRPDVVKSGSYTAILYILGQLNETSSW